jgi:hypothetical protein
LSFAPLAISDELIIYLMSNWEFVFSPPLCRRLGKDGHNTDGVVACHQRIDIGLEPSSALEEEELDSCRISC